MRKNWLGFSNKRKTNNTVFFTRPCPLDSKYLLNCPGRVQDQYNKLVRAARWCGLAKKAEGENRGPFTMRHSNTRHQRPHK